MAAFFKRLAFLAVITGLFFAGGYFHDRMPWVLSSHKIYERARKYTVFISTEFTSYADYDSGQPPTPKKDEAENKKEGERKVAVATGYIVKEGGENIVVSDNHILPNNDSSLTPRARLEGEEKTYSIKRHGWDLVFDIAIFKFADKDKDFKPLGYAILGDSEKLETADSLYLLGNPMGLGFLWSEGKVMRPQVYLNAGPFRTGFITSDASCNPGNSGGPVMDARARVVGTVDAIAGNHPICFIIPTNVLKALWPKLLAGGEIKHGVLGIIISHSRDISPEKARELGLPENKMGVTVLGIWPGSPADKADIRKGDILLSFGKNADSAVIPIKESGRFLEELNLNFFRDDEVALKIQRGKEYFIKKLKLVDALAIVPPLVPEPPPVKQPEKLPEEFYP